jgi:hypothetical protein
LGKGLNESSLSCARTTSQIKAERLLTWHQFRLENVTDSSDLREKAIEERIGTWGKETISGHGDVVISFGNAANGTFVKSGKRIDGEASLINARDFLTPLFKTFRIKFLKILDIQIWGDVRQESTERRHKVFSSGEHSVQEGEDRCIIASGHGETSA